jgi:hypothetical protein
MPQRRSAALNDVCAVDLWVLRDRTDSMRQCECIQFHCTPPLPPPRGRKGRCQSGIRAQI